MITVYLTSQPLSGALRAKAAYRVLGTFIGGAAMIAIVPNLADAPEITTLAIILWVALCAYFSLLEGSGWTRTDLWIGGDDVAEFGFLLRPDVVMQVCASSLKSWTPSEWRMAKLNSLVRNASSICLASAAFSLFFSFKRRCAHFAASSSLPMALSSPSI